MSGRKVTSSSSSSSSSDDGAMSPISPVYGDGPQLAPPIEAPATRSTSTAPLQTSTLGPAASKFRAIAQRVVHMQKSSTRFDRAGAGAEPGNTAGVDPRRFTAAQLYGHMRARCDVTVIDYNSVRSSSRTLDNEGLRSWLSHSESARPDWARVRWVHVDGVDWDILAELTLQYGIHPLALEDILHSHSNSRSKSSYFTKHLFLRVMAHSVAASAPQDDLITDQPRSSSPDDIDLDDVDAPSASRPTLFRKGRSSTTSTRHRRDLESTQATFETGKHWQHPDQDLQRRADSAQLRILKQDEDRVDVALNNLFILLWRDGTVISIYAKPSADFAAPIMSRLKMRDSILRSTADPSLLVQSMLDLVVDQALEVIDRYHDQITKLEATVLVKPKMATVRSLHILSGDMALRKRSLEPIKSLIYGLRRYDRDRWLALVSSSNGENDSGTKPDAAGFMSHKAKIYLADVHDHMDYILSSVDLFTTISENLISYTFNMSGYLTNETMRILTLVTIIFLPLTLLTGYFGMNFEPFPAVNKNSDLLFWIIALPVMVVIIPLFLWSDIQRAAHYLRKTTAAKKVSSAIIAGRSFSTYSRSGTI